MHNAQTISKKIYRPVNLSNTSKLLLEIYPDFENNYLPVNRKKVKKLLSLSELKTFMETIELQEKVANHEPFREYTIVLFAQSIDAINAPNSELLDDLSEYTHVVKNPSMEALVESVLNHFYSKI